MKPAPTCESTERAAVVRWLRDDIIKTREDLERLVLGDKLTRAQIEQWHVLIGTKVGIANVIERGDHIKGDSDHE